MLCRRIRGEGETITRQPDSETLRQIPLFATLGPADLVALQRITHIRHYQRGEIIILKGEQSGPLRYVRSGAIKLSTISAEGREQALRLVAAGHLLNTAAVLKEGPSMATATALEPSEVYIIPAGALRQLMTTYPQMAQAAVGILASTLRELVTLVENLSFHHVAERIARLLLEQE